MIVLTGASSGIGLAAAARLPRPVILHGLEPVDVGGDFSRLSSVSDTAREILARTDRVDVLINNAGMPGPPRRVVTEDGHEITLQVNLLAAALLTELLQPVGRVINVASATHLGASLDLDDLELSHGYSSVGAYARAKLAVVAYSSWLSGQIDADVVSVHPGVISTDLLHAMFGAGGAPVDEAADVLVDLATRPLVDGANYDRHEPAEPNPQALDRSVQARLATFVRDAIAPFT